MAVNNTIRSISIVGRLGRNVTLPMGDVEFARRAGASLLELPGPTRYPVRPHLEPVCNGQPLAARLVDGRGNVAPGVVLFGDVTRYVPLAQAPLAVSIRDDSTLWAYSKDQLSQYDFEGNLLGTRNISGYFLFPGTDNQVWIVEGEQDLARLVDGRGEVTGTFGWKHGPNSRSDVDGSLCRIDEGAFHKLTRAGGKSVVPLASTPNPYEILVWSGASGFITCHGATFCRYDPDGHERDSITIQSVGVSDRDEAFAAGRDGDVVNLWSTSGMLRRLPLDASIPERGAFTVVAVQDDRALVYGQDHAAWYRGTEMSESFTVDNASYAARVFPVRWESIPAPSVCATADGKLVFAASAEREIVIIEIDW